MLYSPFRDSRTASNHIYGLSYLPYIQSYTIGNYIYLLNEVFSEKFVIGYVVDVFRIVYIYQTHLVIE